MTFSISVESNIKEVQKWLTKVEKQQVPFATSQALNATAFDARKALRAQAVKKLDRPTKFTVDSFQVRKASKRKLFAEVFIEGKRARYLKYQIEGGTRRSKLAGIPVNVKLNKFGNIPGFGSKKKVWLDGRAKAKNQFVATVRGTKGLWQRMRGNKLRLLVAFETQARYSRRFPFFRIVQGVVDGKFKRNFDKAMKLALATAR